MHNLNKITYRAIIFSFSALFLLACLHPSALNAQNFGRDKAKELAEEDAMKSAQEQANSMYGVGDLENILYPKDKMGCAMRSSMFFISAKMYKSGADINKQVGIKMFRPLFEDSYDTIRDDGLEKSYMDKMDEYQDCIESAEPSSTDGREYDLSLVHKPCREVSVIISDILVSIKERIKIDSVFDKYEHNNIDLTDTVYEGIHDPIIYFIGTLYKMSKSEPYLSVVERGYSMSVACSL